jgi:hypothetical protein
VYQPEGVDSASQLSPESIDLENNVYISPMQIFETKNGDKFRPSYRER